jgi:uncharacterized protein YijF (DUF1287 family)
MSLHPRSGVFGLLFIALLLAVITPSLAQRADADIAKALVAAADARALVKVRYDGAYVKIDYPGGDVPADTGACSDEIIRVYRAIGIDLQKEVHEDMRKNSSAYLAKPNWGHKLDTNIDHRRVPNLMTYFERSGAGLPITRHADDYLPGDVVAWDLGGGVTHIGMVVDRQGILSSRHKVLHNIGRGPQIEDRLFDWKIIGHYRFYKLKSPN